MLKADVSSGGSMPRVCVLLSVHNARKTVAQAVDSILRQTYRDFEFLIIDDASTDGSAEMLRRYAAQDTRVRLVRHDQNAGLTERLNEGCRLTNCDLIARMDADDEALPQRLAVQCEFMDLHPTVALAGSFMYAMGRRPKFDRLMTYPTDSTTISSKLREDNCIAHPTVMFRREAVLAVGLYRPEFKAAQDYDLWLRMSRRFEIANIPEPLLRYRFAAGGITLARKWEQYYYVYLAKASDARPDIPLEEIEAEARGRHESNDRMYFLSCVAKGTAEELIRLRHWGEAAKVLRKFRGEIGARRTWGIVRELAKTRRTLLQRQG
jgi:glycosyltransferase involved in cell wall biosynthesis